MPKTIVASSSLITADDLLKTVSPFSEKQLAVFYEETPKDKVQTRPAKGGGKWQYVATGYVIETLNRVFGYTWSFEVLTTLEEAAKVSASGTCVVKGRLTALVGSISLVKEQFGRCEVKYKKGTKDFLDFGNDLKAAASDALKKCASEFGLFRDIYHASDFDEIALVSQETKDDAITKENKAFCEELSGAKTANELRAMFAKLPKEVRTRKEILKFCRELKAKLEDGEKKEVEQ